MPTLTMDRLCALWHVDGSHAIHSDGKGHTGGTLTMGKGAVCSTSTKQKLSTRSSTEKELAGADNLMPQVLWTNYFLEAHSHKRTDAIMFQDNKSAMLLEKMAR